MLGLRHRRGDSANILQALRRPSSPEVDLTHFDPSAAVNSVTDLPSYKNPPKDAKVFEAYPKSNTQKFIEMLKTSTAKAVDAYAYLAGDEKILIDSLLKQVGKHHLITNLCTLLNFTSPGYFFTLCLLLAKSANAAGISPIDIFYDRPPGASDLCATLKPDEIFGDSGIAYCGQFSAKCNGTMIAQGAAHWRVIANIDDRESFYLIRAISKHASIRNLVELFLKALDPNHQDSNFDNKCEIRVWRVFSHSGNTYDEAISGQFTGLSDKECEDLNELFFKKDIFKDIDAEMTAGKHDLYAGSLVFVTALLAAAIGVYLCALPPKQKPSPSHAPSERKRDARESPTQEVELSMTEHRQDLAAPLLTKEERDDENIGDDFARRNSVQSVRL